MKITSNNIKKYLISIFILIGFICNAQPNLRLTLDELIRDIISTQDALTQGNMWLDGVPFNSYNELKKLASKNDLVKLLKHKSPIVRCYAFKIICEEKEAEILPILLKHLDDTILIYERLDCLMKFTTPADYCISVAKEKLLPLEKNHLDSIVLFNYKHLRYWNEVIDNHKPHPNNYEYIKTLCQQGNYEALPALAKYRNVGDLSLFIEYFEKKF
jgi:hypothetical protein